ncbi:DUF58 domain-containing protein [Thioalkalivibrio sp. ALE23]|uniref:DUF58 domain-containing protein n=1 Tax=Thioalkalivibrio sp. ALE23 TaxID=1265495 RepID=UPI000360ADEE|nr:DUF58 domain-containing protein [Thioalkalivibrio sp. ALE23]
MRAQPLNRRRRLRGIWQRLRDDAIRWINRRHAHDGEHARLGRDRIYILPTRAGYTLLGIILIMLLGSINYANNMAFLLTFLLAGIGHNAIWYTHRNLLGLEIRPLPIDPVFAGNAPEAQLRLHETDGRGREAITVRVGAHACEPLAIPAGGRSDARIVLPAVPRGVYRLPRQRVDTRFPLGVLEAWSWLNLDAEILVYPSPVDPGRALAGHGDGDEDTGARGQSEEPPDHIRPYRPGDPPGRIIWKAYARSGKLHVRESPGGVQDDLWFDYDALPHGDTETRLSMLCHQVLEAHAQERVWGLRLPGQRIDPGQGPEHRDHCLQALARFRTAPAPLPLEDGA